MLTEFEIKNFKKFTELRLSDLSKINLFFGVNNVGKTTILEAVFAYACGNNAVTFVNGVIPHRLSPLPLNNSPYRLAEAILDLFHDNIIKDKLKFSLSGVLNEEKIEVQHEFSPASIFYGLIPNKNGEIEETNFVERTPKFQVQMQLSANGMPLQIQPQTLLGQWSINVTNQKQVAFNIEYPGILQDTPAHEALILAKMNDILAHRNEAENLRNYSALARSELLGQVIQGLNDSFADLDLKSIENIPYPDGSQAPLSCRFQDGRLLPLYMLGDGVRRWFHIIGNMVLHKNAIHCIEEIDVNFHHQAQGNLSKQIFRYAKRFNNQIFATSHSEEYLHSFLDAMQDLSEDGASLEKDIRVITLREVDGTVRVRTLNGKEALFALDNGLELRV